MSDLKVTKVGQQGTPDQYGNVSYWVECEGVTGGILVKHKPDKPVMKEGDTFQQHGYVGYEEVQKKDKSGTYLKAKRPAQQQSFGGNNGNRSKDPAERESIERQVAAKVASDLLVALMAQGTFKPESADVLGAAHSKLAATVAGGIKV